MENDAGQYLTPGKGRRGAVVWTGHWECWTHRLFVFLKTDKFNLKPFPARKEHFRFLNSDNLQTSADSSIWTEASFLVATSLKHLQLVPRNHGADLLEVKSQATCRSVRGILVMQNSQVVSLCLHFQLRWSGISFLIIRSLHLPNGQGTSKNGHTFRWSYRDRQTGEKHTEICCNFDINPGRNRSRIFDMNFMRYPHTDHILDL